MFSETRETCKLTYDQTSNNSNFLTFLWTPSFTVHLYILLTQSISSVSMWTNVEFSLTVVAISNDYFENLLMSVINFDKQMYSPILSSWNNATCTQALLLEAVVIVCELVVFSSYGQHRLLFLASSAASLSLSPILSSFARSVHLLRFLLRF